MARFEVHNLEGSHYVDIILENEMVRAEAGALCCMTGDITLESRLLPSVGGLIKSLLADEAIYRPTYTGTGIVTLESSFGGFHVLELAGETWILESGAYWASDGSVNVSFHRESILTSLWAGEGFVYLQTKVSGHGKVAVTTRGPVEEIALEPGKKFVAEGKYVIGRTAGVSLKIRRATKSYLGRFTAGEGWVRVYEGTGRILLNPTPYWRYRLLTERA
jgi:uncharacterized protein (AIM24 family)